MVGITTSPQLRESPETTNFHGVVAGFPAEEDVFPLPCADDAAGDTLKNSSIRRIGASKFCHFIYRIDPRKPPPDWEPARKRSGLLSRVAGMFAILTRECGKQPTVRCGKNCQPRYTHGTRRSAEHLLQQCEYK